MGVIPDSITQFHVGSKAGIPGCMPVVRIHTARPADLIRTHDADMVSNSFKMPRSLCVSEETEQLFHLSNVGASLFTDPASFPLRNPRANPSFANKCMPWTEWPG
jgi:hypothetical protein